MKEEVSAAVLFLTRLIGKNQGLSEEKMQTFSESLNSVLMERFKGHWFPEKPSKGQAYRCIRVNETEPYDPILQEAAQKCGLKYHDLKLPPEVTIWVDPHEVCCRFGEHKGSYCTVASFKNGNKENFVDKINIDELEQKTADILKKATQETKRKKSSRKHSSPRKNEYNQSFPAHQGILQQVPALSSSQNFQPTFYPSPVPSFRRSPLPHHLSNYNSISSALTPPTFYPHPYADNNSGVSPSPKYPRSYNSNMRSMNNLTPPCNRYNSTNSSKNDRYHWVNKKSEAKA